MHTCCLSRQAEQERGALQEQLTYLKVQLQYALEVRTHTRLSLTQVRRPLTDKCGMLNVYE